MEGWIALGTFAIAVLGAVLGVINTTWALYRDRVRIQVVPCWCFHLAHVSDGPKWQTVDGTSVHAHAIADRPDGWPALGVINKGVTAITVRDVGVYTSRIPPWLPWLPRRFGRYAPIVGDRDLGLKQNLRMLPRTRLTITPNQHDDNTVASLAKARYMYARTECGVVAYKRSNLLKKVAKRFRAKLLAR